MKILTSAYTLDVSGVPTYTLTMYNELVKRGHDVIVYSPLSGAIASQLKVCQDVSLLGEPDVIIAQHRLCAEDLRKRFDKVPIIFSAHGVVPDGEQPPSIDINWYTAINEDGVDNLVAHGVDRARITIVRDFIDMSTFHYIEPMRSSFPRMLFIDNHRKSRGIKMLREIASSCKLDLKAVGATYGRSYNVELAINNVDLVITTGRGILEAMACGRSVISCDNHGVGDGYIDQDRYWVSRTRNFAGSKSLYTFSLQTLIDEVLKYESTPIINIDFIDEYHNVVKGVSQLMEVVERVL
jgi:hypothetical protein